jgi:maleate isomerase
VKRLGILTPSSNTVVEPTTIRLTAPLEVALAVHFSRFRVTRIDADSGSDEQFASESMVASARLLADARVDEILWSGTSAAWLGIGADRALVAAVREATGIEATTATLGLLDAFRALNLHRYALVVPYVPPIADAIVGNLEALGYACADRTTEGLTTNWEFASIEPGMIADRVRRVARSRPDAVVIHCTNLRGAEVAEALEGELGVPVLDSVVVGLWAALRQLAVDVPVAGFGRLASLWSAAPTAAPAGRP